MMWIENGFLSRVSHNLYVSSPWGWRTELNRAKKLRENAAIVLATFRAVSVLFAAEDHRDSATESYSDQTHLTLTRQLYSRARH